jgi:uncharacterized membrane-anchored protein
MPTIPEPSSPNATSELSPAAALRQRLTHGRGGLLVIIATTLVWVMDALLVHRIEAHHRVAFIIVTVGLAIALYRSRHQHLAVQGGGLANLWDVAAVYMESVIVFMFIYIFLDIVTPAGAFVWPSLNGEAPPVPHQIEYLLISLNFISLNVNST